MRFGRRRSEDPTLKLLRPFLFTPVQLPPVALPVAREVLPGLLAAPVVADGSRIEFIVPESLAEVGGPDAVFRRAASNVAGLPLLTTVVAPEVGPRFGVLVAVPYWRLMLLHVLRGQGGLASLTRLAAMADSVFTSGDVPARERLRPNVFYIAPDGRTQVVAFRTASGPVVETRGLIRDQYFVSAGVLGPEG